MVKSNSNRDRLEIRNYVVFFFHDPCWDEYVLLQNFGEVG